MSDWDVAELAREARHRAQGSLDLRLTIGSAFEYCMRFGGTVRHDAPATSSRAGIFDAMDAPAPACPNGPP